MAGSWRRWRRWRGKRGVWAWDGIWATPKPLPDCFAYAPLPIGSMSNSSSESISSTTPVRMPRISSIRAVVPPKMITVSTTTTSTVALSAYVSLPVSSAASATPTAPRSPAQKSIAW
ncbi:hypothetical protein CMQ_7181 [Grosmannia clavigera kw1407]|uniref:Uncharacterized protein n=1 Tax=Grosmannia clavigera (strain kw1407 / UAMH 11150) TaxID=655863 RepID=F0XPX6_GROCL|nr:uncharacterized protein CMQ_7181 [Grosmannia clavigera kw1407]EFX00179.1 hypothetical protein CMQ_7181 [Grosmannia clavigera kw1407]